MTTTIDARNLVLRDVHHLLKLEVQFNSELTSFLSLEPLAATERQKLEEIHHHFLNYFEDGKILEGEIKFLFVSPLMWLAGFYHPNIRITLEERIADIDIEDEDLTIKGRMDILATERVNLKSTLTALWVLLLETKRERADASMGLPQLLIYAHTSLEHQDSVWGMTTNGMDYQFTYLQKGEPSTYQLFPKLSLPKCWQNAHALHIVGAMG